MVVKLTPHAGAVREGLSMVLDKIIDVHSKRQKDESLLTGLKARLCDTKKSIDNLLIALQEGIITTSTKDRLKQLESEKEKLEKEIANEENKLALNLSRDDVEKYLRKSLKASPKILLNNLVEKVIVYDNKIEIFFKYSHYVPDDPNDQRGRFYSQCKIPVNRRSRTKQVLDITIDKHTIHFFVRYGTKRNKDLCLPINYKMSENKKSSAHVSATCADGSRLVEWGCLRSNAFYIVFYGFFCIVKRNLLYIFAAADIEIHNGIVVADKHLTYKVVNYLLLVSIKFSSFLEDLFFRTTEQSGNVGTVKE